MKPKRRPPPKPRNHSAHALESPLFRMRLVKSLKGKASYKRRPKHRGGAFDSRIASNNRRSVKLLTIDTMVNTPPMNKFSLSETFKPNNGNTASCVSTATP